ncbi:MAG: flavodoxin reductase [Flavobacteriales bacterium]|nr:flavodoxin reductase [Flavobacteriales bacterium]
MEQFIVKVTSVDKITHDVLKIKTEKPLNYLFSPGQATEVAINKTGWEKEYRPFTFTSLPSDNFIEFIVKTYPSYEGMTNELLNLEVNEELIIKDSWGTIGFKGEGIFIAGGAGITPFISIFRNLRSQNKVGNNKLIFANKTKADIINQSEFEEMLGKNFINILSDEKTDNYAQGYITEEFLKNTITDLNKYFYVCGPPPMMDAVENYLLNLNIDKKLIIKEKF